MWLEEEVSERERVGLEEEESVVKVERCERELSDSREVLGTEFIRK